ncbi:hypothetical protein [Streptomyces sp. NPDC059943]|uniref:hypothetical protein n=1 Tax=Streptomyces sp. NPDC059943 TaxID=3347010 RepID=UPI003649F654
MNQLLVTLGTKLTERWLNLLVLPGALFLGVLASGTTLGHAHWYDVHRLGEALDDLTARPVLDRAGTAAVAVAAVLLITTALSLAAQFLGSAVESFWLRESRSAFDNRRRRDRLRAWERLTRERNAAIRDPATPVPRKSADWTWPAPVSAWFPRAAPPGTATGSRRPANGSRRCTASTSTPSGPACG